ncbi:uncharacterized protein B0H18DRAFT_999035 [Fomitopsis serialis]|uniref:uncharacterized protein n=1 Tax=Fomitopsis serialis TaxID=139415 RepID=UPI00200823F7|nr:uncharacterized protein B0H18DRAFT_999035 [Neoantrodia serialis]KAH9928849.1 hypothetical protein B0H18DRAFT_999035 [Neoantrodia serialis]
MLLNMRGASRAPTIIPFSAIINHQDFITPAERIHLRYLSPADTEGSIVNHETHLPPAQAKHSVPLIRSHEPDTASGKHCF